MKRLSATKDDKRGNDPLDVQFMIAVMNDCRIAESRCKARAC